MISNSEFSDSSNSYPLWRYMNLPKLLSLLNSKSLFFSNVESFNDPFEGYIPAYILEKDISFPKLYRNILCITEYIKRHTLVNCWHISEYQSEAMWNLYSDSNGGVVIKTDISSLENSLLENGVKITPSAYSIRRIKYIDYNKNKIDTDNLCDFILYKRQSFEHEKEVRIVLETFPSEITRLSELRENISSFSVEELDEWLPNLEFFRSCEVDLKSLIKEIIIHPNTDSWLVDTIISVTNQYQPDIKITKSLLNDRP